MIVFLARDIPAFVMYCVNGESGSSLLIESTDSIMIVLYYSLIWSSKQDPKLTMVNNCCAFGCNNAIGK